jgi:hypothetical protein
VKNYVGIQRAEGSNHVPCSSLIKIKDSCLRLGLVWYGYLFKKYDSSGV